MYVIDHFLSILIRNFHTLVGKFVNKLFAITFYHFVIDKFLNYFVCIIIVHSLMLLSLLSSGI